MLCRKNIFIAFLSLIPYSSYGTGSEGSSFLKIPVGGRPAALGGAYSALAADAYAPVFNPAGLGYLKAAQISAMHLEYVESIGYEFISIVQPLGLKGGLGFSGQYFHPQDIAAYDINGNSAGSYSSYYSAYSISYGHVLTRGFSLGTTGKFISARISDVKAQAAAYDVGLMFRVWEYVRLAGVAANLGQRLKFLEQEDPLPLAYRLGILIDPEKPLNAVLEGSYDRLGNFTGRCGLEWLAGSFMALRAGYRSDTVKGLSSLAGFSTGFGLQFSGQRFDYSWVPLGDLGQTHYFSILFTFGKGATSETFNPKTPSGTYYPIPLGSQTGGGSNNSQP